MDWKVGDWVIFELSIGEITKLDEYQEFSDGSFSTSGKLINRFRPLTLRGKRIIEYFDWYYKQLYKINGEAGFNHPDIHAYFSHLALTAIDTNDDSIKQIFELAPAFIKEAQQYHSIIQGVKLFRQTLRSPYERPENAPNPQGHAEVGQAGETATAER